MFLRNKVDSLLKWGFNHSRSDDNILDVTVQETS